MFLYTMPAFLTWGRRPRNGLTAPHVPLGLSILYERRRYVFNAFAMLSKESDMLTKAIPALISLTSSLFT